MKSSTTAASTRSSVPTGVGKTTTVAKLAARAVVRFGAANVALLTTDGYRIGAHDQLRIYGRILERAGARGPRRRPISRSMLSELRGRHLVLIDTIGMSQRDPWSREHAAMLAASGDVKRLLLLQTTSSTRTLEEVVTAYESTGVDGCILTKTDEAVGLAAALDVIVRHQMPLHYVTDGQRVPEDLRLPDRAELVREAIEPAVARRAHGFARGFPSADRVPCERNGRGGGTWLVTPEIRPKACGRSSRSRAPARSRSSPARAARARRAAS